MVLDKPTRWNFKPVFGSEIEQVKNGCIASEGVAILSPWASKTGRMAAQVLEDALPATSPFVGSEGGDMCYNPGVAEALGVTIPYNRTGPRHRHLCCQQHPAGLATRSRVGRASRWWAKEPKRNGGRFHGAFSSAFWRRGWIYAILALGVLITYRILDFPGPGTVV